MTQVISMNRKRWRIRGRIRKWGIFVRGRCRSDSGWQSVQRIRQGRHDKGLDTEPTDKGTEPGAEPMRLDIVLIPRQAKQGYGPLDHEKLEVCVWLFESPSTQFARQENAQNNWRAYYVDYFMRSWLNREKPNPRRFTSNCSSMSQSINSQSSLNEAHRLSQRGYTARDRVTVVSYWK
jgi:hypothetical protein